MDKIEMVLQALKYERKDRYNPNKDNPHFEEFERLDEFFATSKPKISTQTGRALFREIKNRYETAKEDR